MVLGDTQRESVSPQLAECHESQLDLDLLCIDQPSQTRTSGATIFTRRGEPQPETREGRPLCPRHMDTRQQDRELYALCYILR